MPTEMRTIALCHDIERGLGHATVDPGFARYAEQTGAKHLERMLDIERSLGIGGTYNVVGRLLDSVRPAIDSDGHLIAFHSFDHTPAPQLDRLRELDSSIRGYRPPNSRITEELTDDNLREHGYEWLASSVSSLGFRAPRLENGIVKIPILFDDFELYKQGTPYQRWAENAVETIRSHEFAAFCVHDCYAHFWLPGYHDFLSTLRGLGVFRKLDAVVADIRSMQL